MPIYRSSLVPLEDLPRLLLAADVHLITLRDPFVGYVLPSKIHACIESGKRILFVGSQNSDVHLLASDALPSDRYCRVDVGDCGNALRGMALHAMEQRSGATERKTRLALSVSDTMRSYSILCPQLMSAQNQT